MKKLKNFLPFEIDTLFYHLLMLTPVTLHALTSSQPGANYNPTSDPLRRMENSSHNQMRNDKNTRLKLDLLYLGRTNHFFYTQNRF